MKEISVSDVLLAFIEKEFHSMLRFEGELREKRKDAKRQEQRESKRIERGANDAEELITQRVKNSRDAMKQFVLKGKSKPDLNNFVYMCDYFLRQENEETLRLEISHRKDIHDWISRFLTKKGYRKGDENKKPYTSNDIKRIINFQFEDWSPNYEIRKSFQEFFDDKFESFRNPKPRKRRIKQLEKVIDKEISDQLCKWNEEARAETERKAESPIPSNQAVCPQKNT